MKAIHCGVATECSEDERVFRKRCTVCGVSWTQRKRTPTEVDIPKNISIRGIMGNAT